jgi:chromate transport protein ChrA
MKYTAILMAIMGSWWIYRFISAAAERGLPTHPLYYISAAIGIIIAFLSFRLTKAHVNKRRYSLIPLFIFIITIGLNALGVELLHQIGAGLFFWYLLSGLGFYGYYLIKQWSSRKELTEGEQMLEDLNKGVALYFLVLTILFTPLLIFVFIMMLIT